MDFGPNNWYPEPVPMWNLQTPTIFIPPSPTLVNPPLSPPPHFSSHSIPPFQSPSIPAFIPNPAVVQSCIAAFVALQQSMDECNTTFREDMQKIQERLQQSHHLIHERRSLLQELRSKVPTAATTPSSGPRYASEDPTLPSPWKGLIDGSTGSLYYWNTATNQTHTVMVENDPVVKVIYVDNSIKGAYLPLSCYDETVFAYPKTNAAEDHHLLVQFFFYLGDLYTRTEKIRESLSYHPTTLQIYVKSLPGTAPASRASNLTDTAATYESVNELEQTVNLSQPCTMLKLEDKLVLKGEDLLGSLLQTPFLYQPSCYARAHK
ncbi:hypothetical protein ACLB2K_069165 [Fragaria x ananassa]